MALRDGLGGYGRPTGFLPEHGLNVHDLGELIRRAGWEVGLIVETEWKVPGSKLRRIDWVWLTPEKPTTPVVAFEIEGPAVPLKSIANDEARLASAGAVIEIIALYSVDHNRTIRDPSVADPVRRVEGLLRRKSVRVYSDVELMRLGDPKGIESLIDEALALLRTRARTASSLSAPSPHVPRRPRT